MILFQKLMRNVCAKLFLEQLPLKTPCILGGAGFYSSYFHT